MVTCRQCWWMSYYPKKDRIMCRRLSRTLKDIDKELHCNLFKGKERNIEEIIKSTDRYYQEIGSEYDETWYSQRARRQHKKLYSVLRTKIAQLVSHGELVLDAGCGTCEWATVMIKKGARVVGIDQSLKMLKVAKEKSASQNLQEDLNLVRADLSLLPFKDTTFRGVTTMFVLGHLSDDKISWFLREVARVSKKDAWMMFVDSRLHKPYHQQEFMVRTLKTGKEYTIYKRFFTGDELGTLLEKRLSRSFSALKLDRYVICTARARTQGKNKRVPS